MVKILGVPFSTLTFEETLRRLTDALRGDSPLHIITANPEIIMMAQKDPRIMELLLEADLVTPDGIGAVWASQYYGEKLEDRVTGIELSTALIEAAAERGLGVFLLGTKPETNRKAVEHLQARYPGLRIGGRDGYFKAHEEADVVAQVKDFGPALLLVGLGMPRQELFIKKHKEETGAQVMIGIGGCIDIWAGEVKRAPKLWQDLRLEWAYRLLSQPSRWKRQLVLPQFVLTVLTDKNRKKV
ncbi:WecB/TagA/CpsF family glycosyltransferase [Tumebacillus sp. DT12]|uniref:N-acetylglucosaminyldiphosphoundecaprenol N-acetyl-beta-D-mannosaminyltransferase n=1 Tax=Tumebacillus lacus TaxID=2995335 RepID=A0ABT3X0J9_9BACL|nr:WecB/TagA/CpsF family glycosyltransferase [Tumebacillus lacus]MCX7569498.1 WecB/TagA/CpsF family glycosyltransferase [Tumebacillus lacus]